MGFLAGSLARQGFRSDDVRFRRILCVGPQNPSALAYKNSLPYQDNHYRPFCQPYLVHSAARTPRVRSRKPHRGFRKSARDIPPDHECYAVHREIRADFARGMREAKICVFDPSLERKMIRKVGLDLRILLNQLIV